MYFQKCKHIRNENGDAWAFERSDLYKIVERALETMVYVYIKDIHDIQIPRHDALAPKTLHC